MKDPLQMLVQLGVVSSTSFPTDSRYHGFSTQQYTAPDGTQITYLARRIVPQPGSPNYATVAQHSVTRVDRLDNIAAKYLGDPLLFWLVCDANGAIAPNDLLLAPGRVLAITTPQGVPGASPSA